MQDTYSKLIKLAAEMAQRQAMPSIDGWRWPTRMPKALRRDARLAEQAADTQCAIWAQQLRAVADEMMANAKERPNAAVKPRSEAQSA